MVLLGRATRYLASISRRHEAKKPCRSVAVNAQTPLFEHLRYARYFIGSYTYRLSRELVLEQRMSAGSSHATSTAATRILTVLQSPNPTSPANEPSNSNPDSDLSSSASAGVGVASTVVGLGLLALTFYLIRRARHRKPTFDNVKPPNIDDSSKAPQLAHDSPFTPAQKTAELDAGHRQMELDSRTFVELHSAVGKGGSDR